MDKLDTELTQCAFCKINPTGGCTDCQALALKNAADRLEKQLYPYHLGDLKALAAIAEGCARDTLDNLQWKGSDWASTLGRVINLAKLIQEIPSER